MDYLYRLANAIDRERPANGFALNTWHHRSWYPNTCFWGVVRPFQRSK